MKEVKAFKTTDGKIFQTKETALEHQENLDIKECLISIMCQQPRP